MAGVAALQTILANDRIKEVFRPSTETATFCQVRAIGSKAFVLQKDSSYSERMQVTRHIFSCLVIAIIVAFSTNGVAMAANGIGHQTHCVEVLGETSQDARSMHAHERNRDGMVTQHATPGHDHDTCMIHACLALTVSTSTLGQVTDTFLAMLSWPEQPLLAPRLAEDLKRPPKS